MDYIASEKANPFNERLLFIIWVIEESGTFYGVWWCAFEQVPSVTEGHQNVKSQNHLVPLFLTLKLIYPWKDALVVVHFIKVDRAFK